MSVAPIGTVHKYTGEIRADDICLITHETVENPVITSCGHLYSRDALKEWLVLHANCPACRRPLDKTAFLTTMEKVKMRVQPALNTALIVLADPEFRASLKRQVAIITVGFTADAIFELFTGTTPACYFTGQEQICSLPTWGSLLPKFY